MTEALGNDGALRDGGVPSVEEGLENSIGEARVGEVRLTDALTCSRGRTQGVPIRLPH